MTSRLAGGVAAGWRVAVGALTCVGCSTLGPTPITTGLPATPAGRPDLTLQVGVMPGYFLSEATTERHNGAGIGQLSAAFDPGAWLRVAGLVIAGRIVGPSHDTQVEPMLGYRRSIGSSGGVAVAGFIHGTRSEADDKGASYEATRIGAELGVDARLLSPSRYLSVSVSGGLSALWIDAEGDYCVDENGHGVDCPEETPVTIHGAAEGLFPAITGGVAARILTGRASRFHGMRLGLLAGLGAMPTVVSGEQGGRTLVFTAGVSLSLAVGASR